ncbi:MAG: YHYH protein [Saprospiraceae bacterium]
MIFSAAPRTRGRYLASKYSKPRKIIKNQYISNYVLKTGSRNGNGISAPCGTYNGRYMQDYEYSTGNGGDLDDCNGVFGVTREFPAGTYYYVVTSTYPMLSRCLKGTPSTDYYNSNALPVEMISFDATVQNQNDVLLEWTTLTETNNKGFELSRSRDWENWEVLDFIEGVGNSLESTDYQYVDRNLDHGEVYYQLKQIDFDGTSDLSEMIVVEIENQALPIKFYPNPTADIIYYDYNTSTNIQAIHLFNIYGQLAQEQTVIDGSISMVNLPKGIYFVIMQLNNGKIVKEKIVKL